jgi:hypothetical protein
MLAQAMLGAALLFGRTAAAAAAPPPAAPAVVTPPTNRSAFVGTQGGSFILAEQSFIVVGANQYSLMSNGVDPHSWSQARRSFLRAFIWGRPFPESPQGGDNGQQQKSPSGAAGDIRHGYC